MKYQRLFDLTMERGGVTLRVADYPDNIVMPTKGYAVGALMGDFATVYLDQSSHTIASSFDYYIEEALDSARIEGVEYVGTWVDGERIVIDLVNVFANREYAMGYAHALSQDAIYDLFNDKAITIKRKGKQ